MNFIGSITLETKRLILKPQAMIEQKRLWEILMILILFCMSYIFEYGYEIQKDSKGKIYNK